MLGIHVCAIRSFSKRGLDAMLGSHSAKAEQGFTLTRNPVPPEVAVLGKLTIFMKAFRDVSLVVILMFVELTYVMMAVAVPDTARDVVEAWNICSGQAFPLSGPEFSGKFRLGPFWFYLISPFACSRNPLMTVGLAVGFISALKYPLAYLLGRRLISRDFAILWMPLIGLLSWPSTLITYTHTSALLTLLLLSLVILVTLASTRVVLSGFLFGVVTSLAINLHPSAFPFVILAVIPLYRAYEAHRLAGTIVLGLTGAVIPFLPVVFAVLQDPGLAERNSEILSVLRGDSLARVPHYLWQMVAGPISSVGPTVSQSGFPVAGLWGLYGGLYLLSFYGSLRLILVRRENSLMFRTYLGLIGLTILFALAVTCLRTYYPYYMLLVAALPFSALLAVSLVALKRWLRSAALIVALSLVVIPLIGHVQTTHRGSYQIPIGEDFDQQNVFTVFAELPYYFWVSVRHFHESAALACGTDPALLHGYMPLQLNDGLDLPTRTCGPMDIKDRTNLLTLPNAVRKAIGRTPEKLTGGQGLFRVVAVSADADTLNIATAYPPYPEDNLLLQRTLSISAPSDALVFLSNLYYFTPLQITELQVSSGDAQVLYQDEYATILECTSSQGEQVNWKITVSAGEASPLDLVAF